MARTRTETGRRGERERENGKQWQLPNLSSLFPSSFRGEWGLETGKNIFATGKLKPAARRTDRMKFYSRDGGWQTVLSSLVPRPLELVIYKYRDFFRISDV